MFMQEVRNLSLQYKNGTSKTVDELRDTFMWFLLLRSLQFLKNIYAFQKKELMNYFFSRDWPAAVTPTIFLLKSQQARKAAAAFP